MKELTVLRMVDKMKSLTKGGRMPNNINPKNLMGAVPPQILKQMGGKFIFEYKVNITRCWRIEQFDETNGRYEFQYSWVQINILL